MNDKASQAGALFIVHNSSFKQQNQSVKESYRKLCQSEPSIPIFSQDWWLDIVCGPQRWDAIILENNGRIKAAMPLYHPLADVISMPAFTQTMGPWFAPDSADTKYTTRLSQRQAISQQLIERLAPYRVFLQNFHHDITDWLPFYWAGFQQTTRYTYLLERIDQPELCWQQMSANIRRNIIKARDKQGLILRKGIDTEAFLKIQDQTFARQGLRLKQDKKILRQLIATCRQRGQGDIWGAFDSQERLHAAAFVVWQPQSAYYLAGGGDPSLRSSGAHSWVMWEAIRYVSQFTDCFDFEGSMLPGVERFFREFGAKQTPYFTITKTKLSLLDRARIKINRWL